jgi:hypothetical protein
MQILYNKGERSGHQEAKPEVIKAKTVGTKKYKMSSFIVDIIQSGTINMSNEHKN